MKGKRSLLRLDYVFGNFRRLSLEEQSKFDSIAASLKEEFLYGSANRLQAVAMLRNLRWNHSMEPIAAFAHEVLRLVALAYPDFADEASTVIARDVFLDGLHPSFQVPLRSKPETASATVTVLVQEVKRLQLAGVGCAAISSSLADAHYDSAGPSHVGFPLASQSANQVSPAINQMSSFDSHVRPTIVSMPQTVNQMSDYFGKDSAVAESGIVQSFRRQESGRAKPARVRACYICGDPDHLRSACPFRRNCHRCLQPGHVSRACLAPRPVRGESASSTAGGGQVANLATEVHGLIMVSAVVNGIACPFLIDTGADVSLLPLEVVQRHALPIRRHVARQPVMVDGSTLRCDGIVSTAVQLGSRSAQGSFYAVQGLE